LSAIYHVAIFFVAISSLYPMAWLLDQLLHVLDLVFAGALWAFFGLTLAYFTVEVLRQSPRRRWRLKECLQFRLAAFFRVITALACTFRLTGRSGPRLVGTHDVPWMSETVGFVVVYLACHLALLGLAFIVQDLMNTFRKRPYSIPRMWRERMDKYVQVREPLMHSAPNAEDAKLGDDSPAVESPRLQRPRKPPENARG
jgi:hypothetical protein